MYICPLGQLEYFVGATQTTLWVFYHLFILYYLYICYNFFDSRVVRLIINLTLLNV